MSKKHCPTCKHFVNHMCEKWREVQSCKDALNAVSHWEPRRTAKTDKERRVRL
jgi:hypothetical protein